MTVARAALKELKWSNKATFKFNTFATQMIGYNNILEQGGQRISDQKKMLKLLDSMSTNNVAIQTCMELVCQGATF